MRRRDAPARHTDGALRETQTGLTNCCHEPAHVAMPTQAGATTHGLSSRVPGDGDGRYLPHLEHRRKRGNASLARRQNGTETHHRSNYERLRRFPAPRMWLSRQSSLARALRSSSSSSSVSYPFSSRARRASSRVPICRRRSASAMAWRDEVAGSGDGLALGGCYYSLRPHSPPSHARTARGKCLESVLGCSEREVSRKCLLPPASSPAPLPRAASLPRRRASAAPAPSRQCALRVGGKAGSGGSE